MSILKYNIIKCIKFIKKKMNSIIRYFGGKNGMAKNLSIVIIITEFMRKKISI